MFGFLFQYAGTAAAVITSILIVTNKYKDFLMKEGKKVKFLIYELPQT